MNLVPIMTGLTTPSPYVISAQSTYTTFVANRAFDKNNTGNGYWFCNGLPAWIKVDLGTGNAAVATGYSIVASTASSSAYVPSAWTFQGSNDDAAWTTLNTQSGISGWTATVPKKYTFSNSTSYRYYRVNFTAGAHATYVGIMEVAIWASENNTYGICYDGDSLGTDYGRLLTATTMALLGDSTRLQLDDISNTAIFNKRIDEQDAVAATNVDPLLSYYSGKTKRYVIFQCGINDIFQSASSATTLSRLNTYVANRISAGWDKVFVFTLTKAATVTGAAETQRVAYNAALIATPPTGSILVDLAARSEFSNTANTTYYQADGVHFTITGSGIVADAILAVLPASTSYKNLILLGVG